MEKTNKFIDPMDKLIVPPPHRTRWEAFRTFMYDSENGTVLGRTASSWAKITTFYIIYYACLAGFWAVCMWGLLQTISEDRPTYQLDESIIGTSPGLASRPVVPEGRESVLSFNLNTKTWSNSEWPDMLGEFLREYENSSTGNTCDFGAQNALPCSVNTAAWDVCQPNENQTTNAACLYFKINKVLEWTPQYYTDVNNLPSDMPEPLKQAIISTDENKRDMVWFACEGRYDSDKQNAREIKHFPHYGFPGYYFPFRRQTDYKSPVVTVYFENPERNVNIDVECRTWAPNIYQDRQNQLAVLNFKLSFHS